MILNIDYSPWTFKSAKPSDKPNKVMKKHINAELTISAFANGKSFKITDNIIFESLNYYNF